MEFILSKTINFFIFPLNILLIVAFVIIFFFFFIKKIFLNFFIDFFF